MSAYSLSLAAGLDLEAIWAEMALLDRDAADRWLAAVFDCFELLARTPVIGQPRRDLTAHPMLFWPVGDSLLLYRAKGGRVEFIAISRGPHDIPSLRAHAK